MADHHEKPDTEFYFAAEREIEEIEEEAKKSAYKMEIIWRNVLLFAVLHTIAAIGMYQAFTVAHWKTIPFMFLVHLYGDISITGGSHRLFTHKAYKANFGVRLFYMIGTTLALQHSIINWSRDHRTHHKWSDCDADPHNIKRGFFFSHMGWLMCKKHPKVIEMGSKIDMSDLKKDPILAFQDRHYNKLAVLLAFITIAMPVYFWGESWSVAFCTKVMMLQLALHGTWTINSMSHTFGYKPFDKSITPTDAHWHSYFAIGEAWHNFHHTFPHDYRASEFYWKANLTCMMIDGFAAMGWVWDRKTMSQEAIERQKLKGDRSRPIEITRSG